jgi:hypothetical protein
VLNYICCLILFEIVSCIKPYDNHYFHGSLFNLKVAINQGWFTISRTFSFDTLLNSNVYINKQQISHDTQCFHEWFCCITGILLCAKTKLARARLASYFADGTSLIGRKRFGKNHLFGLLHLLNLLFNLYPVVYLNITREKSSLFKF